MGKTKPVFFSPGIRRRNTNYLKNTIGLLAILFMIIMTACKGDQKIGEEVSKETDQVKEAKLSDAVDEEGKTLLHKAVEEGDKEKIIQLLDQKIKIDVKDKNGYTPLHWAVLIGQEEIAFLLIARGANVNTTLPGGFTPLHDAVYVGGKNMVQLLIANGARIYVTDKQGKRPLDLAVEQGNQDMIPLLKPLHMAVQAGKLTKVNELLEKNPDSLSIKDENGWCPLHLAVKSGHMEIFKFLVARGADINARGTCGVTPLRTALDNGREKIAALLKAKAAVEESDKLFLKKKLKEKEAIIWYLFHTGWVVKTKNYLLMFDYVPLDHYALRKGAAACLSNGEINPHQIKDQDVVVFVPMIHDENHVKTIYQWKKSIKNITYVFGENRVTGPAYLYIKPRGRKKLKGMEIFTISTTGFGEGFVVKVDGITIFHGGDHESSDQSWNKFTKEIDYLKELKENIKKFDLIFLQMIFQEQIDSSKGVFYALEKLQPKIMFPTTAIARTPYYKEFVREAAVKKIKTKIECAENRGDIFFYKDGIIE